MLNDDSNYKILQDIAEKNLIALDSSFEELFLEIDCDLWYESNFNPKTFLKKLQSKHKNHEIEIKIYDKYWQRYEKLIENYDKNPTYKVAYFSPEFGFHETFPNYAGGLGILAGDIIKSSIANNLGLIGVSLFYTNGYFKQYISNNRQKQTYPNVNKYETGIEKFKDNNGKDIFVDINIAGFDLKITAYKYNIAGGFVVLLSTDSLENGDYRKITKQLYTGDRTLRLLQEIVLGFGGVKILNKLGLTVEKYHINEGHASFAMLERAIVYSKNNRIDLFEAIDNLLNENIFTTHTPVIHGNEEFKISELEKYLENIVPDFESNFPKLIKLGKTSSIDEDMFSMTSFGINLAKKSNGVSKLHGQTATVMWDEIYKVNNKIDSMDYVTNGIHLNSWMSGIFRNYVDDFSGDEDKIREAIQRLKPEILLNDKLEVKNRSLELIFRHKSINQNEIFFKNNDLASLKSSLVIGFARRFASYKRADLIFSDIDRLKIILDSSPVNIIIIFSGKAHPKDKEGKKTLQKVLDSINNNKLNKNIIFIPNYDIRLGRLLVSSTDVWLNTPERPLEACGTSGMKAAANFGINLSINDGWWHEAFNKKNGYSIDGNQSENEIVSNIYNILEFDIIPKYSNAIYGKSYEWTEIMKESFLTSIINFSSERMMQDYFRTLYNA
ncbi:MAG: alpha-glucan family phosphorylase [Candidatus Kapabacteria bacterium]|nr:alpha-glucan family phosphorylase [Ignavibacteriota bacterium]MCW5883542.1 alpha-glucan family phosphorylase [Candidatus Kapabacteria bacterium]